MGCRITEVVVDCADPRGLAEFWRQVLGFTVLSSKDDEVEIGPEEGFGGLQPTLVFSLTTDPRPAKLRLHIDVSPVGHEQAEELARLLALGARPVDVGQDGTEPWHVLADPEGNEFCLLGLRVDDPAPGTR